MHFYLLLNVNLNLGATCIVQQFKASRNYMGHRYIRIDQFSKNFSITQQQHILRFTYKSSICAKTQETNFKILTRWYRTPVKLQKIFPGTSDQCWRCKADKGTILHIFWTCPKLQHFWTEVQRILQKLTEREIRMTQRTFSCMPPTYQGKYTKNLLSGTF